MSDDQDRLAWVEGVLKAVCSQPCTTANKDLRETEWQDLQGKISQGVADVDAALACSGTIPEASTAFRALLKAVRAKPAPTLRGAGTLRRGAAGREATPVRMVQSLALGGADPALLPRAVEILMQRAGQNNPGLPLWALAGLARVWPREVAAALLGRVCEGPDAEDFWGKAFPAAVALEQLAVHNPAAVASSVEACLPHILSHVPPHGPPPPSLPHLLALTCCCEAFAKVAVQSFLTYSKAWVPEGPNEGHAQDGPDQAMPGADPATSGPSALASEPDQATRGEQPDQAMRDAVPAADASRVPDEAMPDVCPPLEAPPAWRADTQGLFESGARIGNVPLDWVLAVLQCQLSTAGVPAILGCLLGPQGDSGVRLIEWMSLLAADSLLGATQLPPVQDIAKLGIGEATDRANTGNSTAPRRAAQARRFLQDVAQRCDEICTAADLRTASTSASGSASPGETAISNAAAISNEGTGEGDSPGGCAAARGAVGDLLALAGLEGGTGCATAVLHCLIRHCWAGQFRRLGSAFTTGGRLPEVRRWASEWARGLEREPPNGSLPGDPGSQL
eukprot:jgi/Botrbrau1/4866/Bobra.0032s0023.2